MVSLILEVFICGGKNKKNRKILSTFYFEVLHMKASVFLLAAILFISICICGCSSKSSEIEYNSVQKISVIVFADKMQIAEKVAMYLEDEPGFNIFPTDDIQDLDSIRLRETDVVILVPLNIPSIPNYIALSLEDFVDKGGGVIGINNIVFNGSKLGKIFGERGYVFPEDARHQKLHIKLNKEYSSPISDGLPVKFALVGEKPIGVNCESKVQRIVDMFYETSDGSIKSYCAAWSYNYGDGKTFAFVPGITEETRYNPYVLRMIANATFWMTKN
ncbi:hypothetical protein GF312_05175 [Candidatus Poribacteria bacterium]|nr:hypothetical protein [Candidatus Poribacteria bacterium]